jgi:hypothetical protein
MESALADMESFQKAYLQWANRLKKEGSPAADKRPPQETKTPASNGSAAGTAQVANGGENDPTEFINEWLRLHGENYAKYVAENYDRFYEYPDWVLKKAQDKYQAKVGEPWPEKTSGNDGLDANAGQTGSGEGNDSRETEIVESEGNQGGDITQTDEWNELMMLQSRYPDIYKSKIAGVMDTKSIEGITQSIAIIEQAAALELETKGGSDDIPL